MKQNEAGMTLAEVLIALAILGIAMTAVIHAVSRHASLAFRLQEKTLAALTGQTILEEIQTGMRRVEDHAQGEVQAGPRTWIWQARREESAEKAVKKLTVTLLEGEEENAPLIRLTGYLYVQP